MDYQTLKNRTPRGPLTGGDEYKLCLEGFRINFQHAEAQSREAAADTSMNEALNDAGRQEQFTQLKAAVSERHAAMHAQFSHIKDCFICSVAFGLTPAPRIQPERKPFTQLLARLTRAVRHPKLKAGLQRT